MLEEAATSEVKTRDLAGEADARPIGFTHGLRLGYEEDLAWKSGRHLINFDDTSFRGRPHDTGNFPEVIGLSQLTDAFVGQLTTEINSNRDIAGSVGTVTSEARRFGAIIMHTDSVRRPYILSVLGV